MHSSCVARRFRSPTCNKCSTVHFRRPSPRHSRNNSCSGHRAPTGIGGCLSKNRPHWTSQSNSTSKIGTASHCHISACICRSRAQNPPRTVSNSHLHSLDAQNRTVCSSACHRPICCQSNTLRRHTDYLGSNRSPSCSFRPAFSGWSMFRCPMCKCCSPEPLRRHCSNNFLCSCSTGIGRRCRNIGPHCTSHSKSTSHLGTALRCHMSACICRRRAQNPPRTVSKGHLENCTVCSSACHRSIYLESNTLRRHTFYLGSNRSPSCSCRPGFATALAPRGARGTGRQKIGQVASR